MRSPGVRSVVTVAAPIDPSHVEKHYDAVVDRCLSEGSVEWLVGGRKLVVRVDRVELSKNILRGFWAFEELLETRPEWRGQVVMLALAAVRIVNSSASAEMLL